MLLLTDLCCMHVFTYEFLEHTPHTDQGSGQQEWFEDLMDSYTFDVLFGVFEYSFNDSIAPCVPVAL